MKDRLLDLFGDGEPIDIELGPNGELPPGFHYLEARDIGFREFCALNGESKPADDWPPEDVVAWFLDERPQ
jgi:hypothetical protein